MQTILIDVDTQFDFVNPAGTLYVPARETVAPAIREALTQAASNGVPILGSVDSHAYDAWEFTTNGGPFPEHCIKGRTGWLREHADLPTRTRFLPMQEIRGDLQTLVGAASPNSDNRVLTADDLVAEARAGIGLYFEKEVYSLFSNPMAEPLIAALVDQLGGKSAVRFDVLGYCTGGYCVDAAAHGLAERGYQVRVLGFATAAIGGDEGAAQSREELSEVGIEWLETPPDERTIGAPT